MASSSDERLGAVIATGIVAAIVVGTVGVLLGMVRCVAEAFQSYGSHPMFRGALLGLGVVLLLALMLPGNLAAWVVLAVAGFVVTVLVVRGVLDGSIAKDTEPDLNSTLESWWRDS